MTLSPEEFDVLSCAVSIAQANATLNDAHKVADARRLLDRCGIMAHRDHRVNPFRKETWNLTHQMKLKKQLPRLAARLEQEAKQ